MRQATAGVGLGVAGLSALLLVTACARQTTAAGRGPAPDGSVAAGATADDARAQIAAQVARRVDAMKRKDVDAMLDGAAVFRGATGEPVSREQVRAELLRDWASVDRTKSLSVDIDSVHFADSARATVYTTQRWRRTVFALDGSKHDVQTTTSIAQAWARTVAGWRGLPEVALLSEGPTIVDGRPARQAVLVRGQ